MSRHLLYPLIVSEAESRLEFNLSQLVNQANIAQLSAQKTREATAKKLNYNKLLQAMCLLSFTCYLQIYASCNVK